MTTIARTNMCTNPACAVDLTGWSYQAGTGEVSAQSRVAGGPSGTGWFDRQTVTTAKTGGNSGTFRNDTGATGVAGDVVTGSVWVRCSVAVDIKVSTNCRVGTGSTSVGSVTSASVTLVPNTWTRISATATATGAYGNVQVWAILAAGSIIPAGGTLDATQMQIEKASAPTTYFDGSTAAVNNFAYQWTGTAGSSTSQEYYALPTVLTVAKTDAPCPRTEVTVVGLGTGTTVFNVWRTADGTRKAVRGARNRSGVDSDFVVDYEAPLNRSLTYDIEVISGSQVTQPTYPATITVLSSTWWIQDPLVPSSAIPLNVSKQDSNAPYLTGNAIKSLEYGASVTLIPILGSTDPVALMGNRTIAGNVTFDMFTNLASVTTQLRNLIQQTPLLLIRSTGTRNNGIPGLAYFTSAKPSEKPVTVAFGGTLTNWSLTGDLVAAPTMNVLVPIWTYGTVAALWTTYQQAQTTLAAKTYLDVLKSPAGT